MAWSEDKLKGLDAEILRQFEPPPKEIGSNETDFWASSHCYLEPADFPRAFGHNMHIILRALLSPHGLSDKLRRDISLMLLAVDVAPDEVLRDETMPVELKREYIENEMRITHREFYGRNHEYCSRFTEGQRKVISDWLECLVCLDLAEPDLLAGWRAFCRGVVPGVNE